MKKLFSSILAMLLLSGALIPSHVCAESEPCCKEVEATPSCHEESTRTDGSGLAPQKVQRENVDECCANCNFQDDRASAYLTVPAVGFRTELIPQPIYSQAAISGLEARPRSLDALRHPPPSSYSYVSSRPSFGRSPPAA